MIRHCALIGALFLSVALAACGGGNSEAASDNSQPETAKLTKPKVEVPQGSPPTKLVEEDLRPGSGPAAKVGDEVTVQYVGVEYKSGKQIDASWDRGEPLKFRLGSGGVIQGWEEGVSGMKVGGRRQLIIPSKLAYGSGVLVFVIDLLKIDSLKSTYGKEAERPKPRIRVPNGPPPKKLVVKDLIKGTGPAVGADDEIVVNYIAVNYKTGEEFETTYGDRPSTFPIDEVIKGWEIGLKGMKVGGRRELIIPSKLGYGTGALIYVVDLLEIK